MLLVLIAIAPAFVVVVQASLSEQQARLKRAETGLRSLVDLSAAHQEWLPDGAYQSDREQAVTVLRSLMIPPEVTLVVTDANAVVLASAGATTFTLGAKVPQPLLREAIAAGKPHFDWAGGVDGPAWSFAVEPVHRKDPGKLFVAGLMSSADVLAGSTQRLNQQLGALALMTLLGAAAAWLFGDRVVARPIGRLLQRIDALAREELRLDTPPATGGLRELSELDRRFHDMARRLAAHAVQHDGAMAEMAHQNNLLESVLASMTEGVLVLDSRGRVLHINDAASRILPGAQQMNRSKQGLSPHVGDPGIYALDGVTALSLDSWPSQQALQGQSVQNFRYLTRGPLSAGQEKIIQGSATPIRAPDGKVSGAVIVFSDITTAWQAEQTLKDSELRYRTLFESNPYPMWVFDIATLRFLTVNDAAVARYGYSHEEFLAMTIADIRPPQDMDTLQYELKRLNPLSSPKTWRHRRKDGRLVDVEITSHAMEYAGRPARMVLAMDITLRLEAEEAMKNLNEILERRVEERTRELHAANKELETFSYSVSHDLRAPLQVIDGFGRALLLRHARQLDGEARHYLNRIRENTRQMNDLIDTLLSLARVTRAEIVAEHVNLAGRAQQIVAGLRHRFPDREVEVLIDPDMACEGDARLLTVVLENLIENAWKFTNRTAQAQIRIGRQPGEGDPVFFVADNGAGFDMAYADKLFHAFQRLHDAADFQGTGIGLATVHRIITRHGGRVWAEASLGQGASFQFSLKPGSHQ
jgi:PAS domain S-box-containing protein